MELLVAALALIGALAAILGAFVLLARRIRRRGIGGALLGPIDEIYHPAAHRYRHEIQMHEERLAPRPAAADDD